MQEKADIYAMVAAEFQRLGFERVSTQDIAKLVLSLDAQDCEYDELSVMAACVGYATAKGMKF